MQIITQPILPTLLLQNLKMQQFFLNIKIILIPMRSKENNQYVLPLSIVAYSSLPLKKNVHLQKKLCSPQSAIRTNSALQKKLSNQLVILHNCSPIQ